MESLESHRGRNVGLPPSFKHGLMFSVVTAEVMALYSVLQLELLNVMFKNCCIKSKYVYHSILHPTEP